MECHYACRSADHGIARRRFLGRLGAGAAGASFAGGWWGVAGGLVGGFEAMAMPAAAEKLARDRKRVLVIFLAGGVSQLESWDPKPGTPTGGPFRAIPTTVKGLHISELLPHTARQMHRLAVVRSINTREDNHGKGKYLMTTGRRQDEPGDYPHLGAVTAKALADDSNPLPGHIQITPKGGNGTRRNDAAYLGPRFASVALGDGNPPAHSARPAALDAGADRRRHAIRRRANARFLRARRTAMTDLYAHSFEQAQHLMERREVFDVSRESDRDVQRYGTHDFGRHCLLARRLLEKGITFVQVTHTNYDTHNENFSFHIEQLGEFDRPFATLIEDLADRGMLESTLVVVMSEFGRTPRINTKLGRDHWSRAWSVALGGCGIVPGAVYGRTNPQGTAVADDEVDHGRLFHTYLKAVGLDPAGAFDVAGRRMPLANPASFPIRELLA